MRRTRISELVLERVVAGEIEAPADLDDDPLARERIDRIEHSNREILDRYPPDVVVPAILSRAASSSGRVHRPSFGITMGNRTFLLAAAVAVVLLGGVFWVWLGGSRGGTTDGIRLKGLAPSISIYRQTDRAAERLNPEDVVSENDLLQIAYVAAGKGFGAIISIDGRGAVTMHYPYETNAAPELSSEGEVALDYSYRLDNAPEFERFFFLTNDTVFDVSEAFRAAESLSQSTAGGRTGDLRLPAAIGQFSVLLQKESIE